MFWASACFVIGVLWVQHSAGLHSLIFYCIGVLAGGLLLARRPGMRTLALCLLGCAFGAGYATWRAELRLQARLPDSLDRTTVQWEGRVTGLPVKVTNGVRFVFQVKPSSSTPVPMGPVALSWYPDPAHVADLDWIQPGVPLALSIRLRRVTSLFNPGGYDHAGRALSNGLAGRGYVVHVRRMGPPCGSWIDRTRFELRAWIDAHAPPSVAGPLAAMALGEQRGIDDTQWDILRATGTAHLVAISGLHVSIVAGLVGGCVAFLWRRTPPLANRWPTRHAAVVSGLLAVIAYAALAGFGIPVTRALIMVAVAALALISGRRVPPFRTLTVAMVAVLLFDPWAVLSPGFWLSFGAVTALLLVLHGRVAKRRAWIQFLLAQWAITWLTLPIVLGVFGEPALVSPVANLVAIPWISFVVVPTLLLAMVSGSTTLLGFAGWNLQCLLDLLAWLAQFKLASGIVLPPLWLAASACVALTFTLLPRGTPLRLLSGICVFPLILWRPDAVPMGAVRLHVIDVGQGLSVLVQTRSHSLLYDAGRKYYRGGDVGRSVVLPALASLGVTGLDLLVLSHDDSDHVGGAASILDALPVGRIAAGVGVSLGARAVAPCEAGSAWMWDGVAFEWLYPGRGAPASADNDRSCVLRIRAGGRSALLTGDITHSAESMLVSSASLAHATVVVAPHHGSKSSSSAPFVSAVAARHVIFSAGFRNAYGHPAQSVVERWQASGADTWNTAHDGALTVDLNPGAVAMRRAVDTRKRYWHRP